MLAVRHRQTAAHGTRQVPGNVIFRDCCQLFPRDGLLHTVRASDVVVFSESRMGRYDRTSTAFPSKSVLDISGKSSYMEYSMPYRAFIENGIDTTIVFYVHSTRPSL